MKVEMLMPQMGESIAEATISKWRKKPGDPVQKDEIILEISTDKVDSEIPAPAAGVLAEVLFNEGDVVPVKTKIAVIDTAGSAASSGPKEVATSASGNAALHVVPAPQSTPTPAQAKEEVLEEGGRYYSPLVKSLAEKHGVSLTELASIAGSGQGGRVTKEDFLKYVESRSAKSTAAVSAPTPTPSAPSARPAAKSEPAGGDWGVDGSKVVVMDAMRQAIADHMVRSKHTSPHVYSIQEVDVTNIANWRAKHKSAFEKSEGFGLSFTPFFLEATVKALEAFPYVNASVDGKKIILKKHVNLGCAVALGNTGLIVPVIKKAEEKNLVGIARSLNDLAQRARNKKLVPDDVAGGTFTVTNPGVFGTIIGTPIINQPQVAILCLGAIKKRPVVIDDMIAIRQICYLTLSYDHRIVDGSLGGQFLAFIRDYLENWDMERTL
ncbi:MAG: dihydrolipoamide acetyltransferase family protein [Pseudomonadota bacterium]|jgi:2-oxoglutarate dehydrogenase E2 component (dihydrolipoamide succinyltransferase)